jgi:hypothetical protein
MTLHRRISAGRLSDQEGTGRGIPGWTEPELDEFERENPQGLTVQQIVEAFTLRGERLTEATFRKYVQLGLLPRSVRVGRKGKHRGSQGLYPATAVRQLDRIRRLMGQGHTIEEIQKEFLFVRGDIDALGRQLQRVHEAIESAVKERGEAGLNDPLFARALEETRELGEELLRKLRAVENRLTRRARMDRAVV